MLSASTHEIWAAQVCALMKPLLVVFLCEAISGVVSTTLRLCSSDRESLQISECQGVPTKLVQTLYHDIAVDGHAFNES